MDKIKYLAIIITANFLFANTQEEANLAEINNEPTVSVHAEDTHLPTILSMLAKQSSYNIVTGPNVQTQEKLTIQVAKTLMDTLDARGVAVTIDATHQCMTMRGIRKAKASTITNYYLGVFKKDLSYQNRYLKFISNK